MHAPIQKLVPLRPRTPRIGEIIVFLQFALPERVVGAYRPVLGARRRQRQHVLEREQRQEVVDEELDGQVC